MLSECNIRGILTMGNTQGTKAIEYRVQYRNAKVIVHNSLNVTSKDGNKTKNQKHHVDLQDCTMVAWGYFIIRNTCSRL